MTSGVDIWGIVAGAIGVLGLIPIIYALLVSQLPATKLADLVATLEETDSLFRSATEEGLLKDKTYISDTTRILHHIRSCTEECRVASHCATTLNDQVRELLGGLSARISILCEELKEVRAKLSKTSCSERKRMMASRGGISDEALLITPNSPLQSHTKMQDTVVDMAIPHVSPRATDLEPCSIYLGSSVLAAQINRQVQAEASSCPVQSRCRCQVAASDFGSTSPSLGEHIISDYMRSSRYKLRTYFPRAAQKILQHMDRDIAVRGQRHPVLTRLVRSKHIPRFYHVTLVRDSDEKRTLPPPSFFRLSDAAVGIKAEYTDKGQDHDDEEVSGITDVPPVYSDIPLAPGDLP